MELNIHVGTKVVKLKGITKTQLKRKVKGIMTVGIWDGSVYYPPHVVTKIELKAG